MNKLTPEEIIIDFLEDPKIHIPEGICRDYLSQQIKDYAAQEVAEAKNNMWMEGGNVIITFDEYNLLKQEIAEKEKQLEKAKELLEMIIESNEENPNRLGTWWSRSAPLDDELNKIKHFLTELKQGQ